MRHKAIKYIIDIQNTIREIEEIKAKANNNYHIFSKDIILQRAIERDLEIIGEAIKKLLEIDASIPISSVRHIVGLRNIIAHAYDAVDIALLWSIIQKDIPLLSSEIDNILDVEKLIFFLSTPNPQPPTLCLNTI